MFFTDTAEPAELHPLGSAFGKTSPVRGSETRVRRTQSLVSITQKVLELWKFTVKNENIGHMSKKSGNGNEISSTESTGVTAC